MKRQTPPRQKLDRKTAREIERQLRERHAQLTALVRQGVRQNRAGDEGRPPDEAVWATVALDDEIQVALIDRHSRQVAQIEAAIERLGRGRYGFCHDCEEPIPLARLRVLPFAQRCSYCQSRAETRAPAARPRPVAASGDQPEHRRRLSGGRARRAPAS